jgi:hypothetical protein
MLVKTFYDDLWVGDLPIDKGTLLDTIKAQYTTFHSELQAFLSDLENRDETNNSWDEAFSAESAPVVQRGSFIQRKWYNPDQ